ncbi:MAG TPA: organic hydroperoxide resistance protein [Rhizomicrobium sp.]|jgi:Ohr subfamily peroxiredoxin|nr:organic hydroperoxide resistance protein [Rhizomicrobium sp.]
MSDLYVTRVSATGGRHGTIKSEDGLLALNLALPKALGGPGGATNPEQLFAGGYAACFENAILRMARESGIKFNDSDVAVVAEIGIRRNEEGNFVLSARLDVTIAGHAQARAEDLVHRADRVCPYSNAVRGNIDVHISVKAI